MKHFGVIFLSAIALYVLLLTSCTGTRQATALADENLRQLYNYYYTEGKRQQVLGDNDAAFALFSEASRIDTAAPAVQLALANYYLGLNQADTAIYMLRKAAEGDIATVDYCELDADGNPVESTRRNDFTFTIGSSYNMYRIDSDIIGMEVGQEKTIEKTYGEDEGNADLRGRTLKLSVKLTKLKERVLPEVDDEFAQDIKEEYKTVKDLRDSIRKNLQEQLDNYLEDEKYMALFSAIGKDTKMTIPASMKEFSIRSEIRNYMRNIGRSSEDIDKLIAANDPTALYLREAMGSRAVETLRQQLILQAIQKQGVVKLDEGELDKALSERLNDGMDEETRKRATDEIRDELEFAKVPKYLLENNTFEKTGEKLGFKAFMEEYYKKANGMDDQESSEEKKD